MTALYLPFARYLSVYRFKIAIFAQCIVIVDPSGGTPNNINVIYASLKSTFSGLQYCHWQYRSIFMPLAVVASQICEIMRNSEKIRTYSSSRSSKVINLGATRKRTYNFLLIINPRMTKAFCAPEYGQRRSRSGQTPPKHVQISWEREHIFSCCLLYWFARRILHFL